MLKRSFRLRARADIKHLRQQGKIAHSAFFSCKSARNSLAHTRAMVVVSTKISKKATVRNRIRRRVNGVLQAQWASLPTGVDIMIIVRVDISRSPLSEIEKQLLNCLQLNQSLASNASRRD